MTRKFRRFIFWIFAVLFIIVSIFVILFAQGWQFDFNSFKLVKTGGIFIKTSVSGAKIYINDKYIGSTGGILNYTKLLDGFTPKNYNVFVYKEYYYPWNKIVEVKSGLVTEISSIVLFPLNLKKIKITELPMQTISSFSVVNETIKITNSKKPGQINLYNLEGRLISSEKSEAKTATSTESISPDENKKLYAINNQVWIDYLNNVTEEPSRQAGEKELVAASEEPILFLDWFKDSEHIIWITKNDIMLTERDNRGDKRNSIKFNLSVSLPIFWDNKKSDLYFFERNKSETILYKISVK